MTVENTMPESTSTLENGAKPHPGRHFTIIEPGRTASNYWRDLWRFRELFLVLAWRDVTVRYKQSIIGVGWALIRPLLTMVVFTVIFGRIAGLPSPGGVPYTIMVFAAMLPWFLFSSLLGDASGSVAGAGGMISKIYYPRLINPFAKSIVSLIDFSISLALLAVLMVAYAFAPDWRVLFLPVFILLAVAAAMGPALLLAALNVRYRDFRFIVPFIIQFGLYVSPVGFSSAVVPEAWRWVYGLNPLVAVIEGFRWCLLRGEAQLGLWVLPGLGVVALMMWAGLAYFKRTERTFADVI
ncbi:ABC transporter permease [Acuticoccus yangtzensis]|uniref:ABC transporter permease n=1 Tax=Acuticoccus yangtzensis TaxID=1443441 RepID=UPI00196B9A3C|nr:ABC transporter permease [Acuticoccus yangtzensis]